VDIDNLMREFKPCIKHDRYEVSCISVLNSASSPPHFLLQVLYIPVAYSIKEGRLVHSFPYLHDERLSSQSLLVPHLTPLSSLLLSYIHMFLLLPTQPHLSPLRTPSYLLPSPMFAEGYYVVQLELIGSFVHQIHTISEPGKSGEHFQR